MRTGRLIVFVVLAGIAAAASVAFIPSFRIATAFTAHTFCSQTFVSGLDPDRVFAETLAPWPGLRRIAWAIGYRVDRTQGQVTAQIAGLAQNRAVYRAGYGCLVVHGAVPPPPPPPADVLAATEPVVVAPDNELLSAALDHAFAEPAEGKSRQVHAVIVVHDGRIVAERYAPHHGIDTPEPGYSATKSVISALIGTLVQQGRLDVAQPAPIAAWSQQGDPRHAITIDHLLRMTSGLALNESSQGGDAVSRMLFLERDMAGFAEQAALDTTPWEATTGRGSGSTIPGRPRHAGASRAGCRATRSSPRAIWGSGSW